MKKRSVFLYGLMAIVLLFVAPKIIRYIRYNKAEGTVVRIKQGIFGGLHGKTTFNYPVISFKTNSGEDVLYAKDNEVLYSVPPIGDKVTVIYNPENPQQAWLSRFGSFWFALPDLMIAGLCFIAWYGIVNIIFVKPRKKKAVDSKHQ
jgi:hypothetical protein